MKKICINSRTIKVQHFYEFAKNFGELIIGFLIILVIFPEKSKGKCIILTHKNVRWNFFCGQFLIFHRNQLHKFYNILQLF